MLHGDGCHGLHHKYSLFLSNADVNSKKNLPVSEIQPMDFVVYICILMLLSTKKKIESPLQPVYPRMSE